MMDVRGYGSLGNAMKVDEDGGGIATDAERALGVAKQGVLDAGGMG